MKHVAMFSSGAGSAMAAKRVAERYEYELDRGIDSLTLLFADVNGEHGDNYRFLQQAAKWIGGELIVIDNGGRTIWQVFSQVRFLGNDRIDPCSRVLKREPMRKWLEDECDPELTIVYLGFDWTEEHRWQRAKGYWEPWEVECPLLWEPLLDKSNGMALMAADGIQPPLLTRQGFPHANCGGGCVKAGIKQFEKLLQVSPDEFAKWEWNENRLREELGDVAILTDRHKIPGKVCVDGQLIDSMIPNRRPLPLTELRERVQANKTLDYGGAEEEWGACNCFTPIEES